jgi:4-hydroxybenzoate polyprenyltransferase
VARVGDLAELVRLPAVLTVPGDPLAGAAAAGFPLGVRTSWRIAASICLYLGGMALNDWADRELDAVERPERPIPSGRVSPGQALGLAAGLTAAGLSAAAAAGGIDALTVATPLAAVVWAYDLRVKHTPLGPVAMAAARALSVLLGSGAARAGRALPRAGAIGIHALALTALSRGEVHGAGRLTAGAPVAATIVLTALSGRGASATAGVLAAGYAASVLPAQLKAARDRTAGSIRRAVGTGILGTVPLQAVLLARAGTPLAAVVVAALWPLARAASRRVAAT